MIDSSATVVPGQRWVSDSEPELGLGTIVSVAGGRLEVRFHGAEETRRYSAGVAPLHRVTFGPGDHISDLEGNSLTVTAVENQNELFFYLCGETVVPESDVSPLVAVGGPRERLLAGRFDPPKVFDLRRDALERWEMARRSKVRGLIGPRIELLPHQFYIASEVTSRRMPRVLLADETGLGKTIEACLILHRLLLTGRVKRALILVPDALVHQWLVELRRRFNLKVALFDEARCRGIEQEETAGNPFEDEQLILAGWSLLVDQEGRTAQAESAGWDLVVVDEAHHLSWTDGEHGPEYAAVERVSAASDGLLLLTATPTQLGEEGHFARLRLLDPARHSSFGAWKAEADLHQETARLGALLAGEDPLAADVLADLIDRHGPGRVIFRNTRAVLSDLPTRQVRMKPVAAEGDARIDYLESLLKDTPDEKLLVICREADTTTDIKDALELRMRADIGLFHEGLNLVQRDRHAAWFVEPDGARMLLCSEIGSEGRNFQHARHLVMYDLPLDPDLVEQRIGRIDRIGQHRDVLIDVLYEEGTGEEVLARWHHEGVNAFERPVATAQSLLGLFGERVTALMADWDAGRVDDKDGKKLEQLIQETAVAAKEFEERVESGRDRLLEMSSLQRDVAQELLEEVEEHDDDALLDGFFLGLLEHFQVIAEEIGPGIYRFDQEDLTEVNFSALSSGDVSFTFDRETALLREDYEFASMDHPLLLDAMGLLIESEAGKASFAVQVVPGPPALLVEAMFVLEVVAPPGLHVSRFLPPTCIRIVVDQTGADCTEQAGDLSDLPPGSTPWFREKEPELRARLLGMMDCTEALAAARAKTLRAAAGKDLTASVTAEVERLKALAKSNDRVRPEEIQLVEDELASLEQHVGAARLRLDALRFVWRGASKGAAPLKGVR
jgi:ATP-dependent helicase HepA